MTTSLDRLPFDLLFCIASDLNLEDIVHLGQTCRQLRALLEERTLCRRTVEISYPHTEEARLAQRKQTTYKEAFQAIYDRKHALSTAYPFSARILGYGTTFLYRQSTICVLDGEMVRVSDVHTQSDTVLLDLTAILRPILPSASALSENLEVRLLNYADKILAVHTTQRSGSRDNCIVAINTTADPPKGGRIITVVPLAAFSKLFVRHNARYLYYGTHTGTGGDGHHKWEIDGVSLNKEYPLPERERSLLLDDFHGSDIGSTVAFDIHNDYFYAVSNQGTFEVEEIDYTSFYHVVRFPLNRPLSDAVEKDERLYRRQHRQGPIHDSWTDLTLQLGERTNETVIVESRREWAQASSRQSRTFYITRLEFDNQIGSPMASTDGPLLPENDPYLPLLDSSNDPHWKETPDLYSWSQHPEFPKTETSPRSFILARTKFRAYSYSCTSFLDLVEDDRCCNDPSQPPCFRLRVGSRRELGLDVSQTNSKGKARANDTESTFMDDKTQYQYSPIRMWPPPASVCPCSKRLHGILNPPLPSGGQPHSRSVTGVLDERCFVFMVKAGRSYGSSDDNTLGTIVVVDFSRSQQHLDNSASSASMSRCDSKMEDDFSPASWEWVPGLEKRCRAGTCR
ncbi:hypothetical protein BDW02DRAFT_244595 [Decorospora gaudefroyi]|uniref:F-box domain-containing protein n=1 Tax=Decorospora gaudefroyi TaxID=184978 RepID=A0A6A5KK76_9PLEO|nr:hypothetical protein BDW02DRAFT_244595 [Decorospora gaudefroyi]